MTQPTPPATEQPDTGRCGDSAPTIRGLCNRLDVCALPHGHTGWHRSDEGAEWSRAESRCPNCDHTADFHSEGGCWYVVAVGAPGSNLACPCPVVGATR